jgi:hypothetical protein
MSTFRTSSAEYWLTEACSMHKDYNCAMNVTKTAVDDPGVAFYENHVCGAACNYAGYRNRNAEVDKLIDKQSAGA